MKKIVGLIVWIITFFFLSLSTSAYYYNGYGMTWGEWLGWFGMWFSSIIFILFLCFVVYFAVMMNKGCDSYKSKWNWESPLDLLKKRLVKWEIDEKEYDKLKKKLEEKD